MPRTKCWYIQQIQKKKPRLALKSWVWSLTLDELRKMVRNLKNETTGNN